jgi:hypothetical protein
VPVSGFARHSSASRCLLACRCYSRQQHLRVSQACAWQRRVELPQREAAGEGPLRRNIKIPGQ